MQEYINNEEIIKMSKNILNTDKYKDFYIQYIIKNRDEYENTFVLATNGDEMIGFNPFDNEIEQIPDWAYNFDDDFFEELEWNKEIIYMTDDFHYDLWTDINKFYPNEFENKEGVIEYLKYCERNGITQERLQKVCTDVPLENALNKLNRNIRRDDSMAEHEIKFYSEEEIKEIINSKEELYFIDDGIDEAIIRLEDIPDAIVDINRNIGITDLSFYKVGNLIYEPELTTMGEYLNKINPSLREQIIDRLVLLQTGECEIKDYKMIDEDLYQEIKNQIEKEEKSNYKSSEKKKKNREAR